MKITLPQATLKKCLETISRVIPSKPSLPILSSVYLKIANSQLTLAATDLYLGIKTTTSVDTDQELEVVIPGDVFRQFINSYASHDQIELDITGLVLTLKAAKTQVVLNCQPASDYPSFPEVTGEKFSLASQVLEKVKQLVTFAAGTDLTRPVLTTVLFNFQDSGLEIVATDGFRLAVLDFPDITTPTTGQVLFPVKAFNEVLRIATQEKDATGEINVDFQTKQAKFVLGTTEVYIRLIEGEYPPYEKIIPHQFEQELEVDRDELKEEIKRALIMAKETSNTIKLAITSSQIEVTTPTATLGSYQSRLELLPNSQVTTDLEIAFNGVYLLDLLQNLATPTLRLGLNDSLKPVLFTSPEENNFRYIVMPFKVNQT